MPALPGTGEERQQNALHWEQTLGAFWSAACWSHLFMPACKAELQAALRLLYYMHDMGASAVIVCRLYPPPPPLSTPHFFPPNIGLGQMKAHGKPELFFHHA